MTDHLSLQVKRAVLIHTRPTNVHPWFSDLDRPIALTLKSPDNYRVEASGWDAMTESFTYVLCHRSRGDGEMLVVKESNLVKPVVCSGEEIKTLLLDNMRVTTARVEKVFAARSEVEAGCEWEYRYLLVLEHDGAETVVSADEMMLLVKLSKVLEEVDGARDHGDSAVREDVVSNGGGIT